MTTIFKYRISFLDDPTILRMPTRARVLSAGIQGGVVFIWVEVDPDADSRERAIYLRGTGHPMGEAIGLPHIGTVFLQNGLVFHIFDGGER